VGPEEELQHYTQLEFRAEAERGAAFCLEGFLEVIVVTFEEVEVVGSCDVGDVEDEVVWVWFWLLPAGHKADGLDDGVRRWSWLEKGREWW
jgi:hypothetical protein